MLTLSSLSILLVLLIHLVSSQTTIWHARADLHGDSNVLPMGTLLFTQLDGPNAPVRVTGRLTNLVPNTEYHGFHVHVFALPDFELNCSMAGDHWNPYGTVHGARYDPISRRHVGDLGNIWADPFGVALINFEDSIIQLAPGSPGSIVDRSIVVHRDPDDFGRGMFTDSLTTGHSGARIACGNIRLLGNYPARINSNFLIKPSIVPRRCDCTNINGQCVTQGQYGCSYSPFPRLMQCMGRNQWIGATRCQYSCRISIDGQAQCT